MVRDLTKSFVRLSWAMGMLGAEQASQLVRRKGWRKTADRFDAVSHAAEDQMGDNMRNVFKAGDHFQDGVWDAMGKFTEKNAWKKPGETMSDAWETLDRAWSDLRADLEDTSRNARRDFDDEDEEAEAAAEAEAAEEAGSSKASSKSKSSKKAN